MSNSSLPSTTRIARAALPVFTGLFGIGAIANGLTGLARPVSWGELLGLRVESQAANNKAEGDNLSSQQKALIHLTALRNVTSGIAILGLTVVWRFSDMCRFSPIAADAVKRCLGVTFAAGSLAALGDGMIIKRFADAADVSGETEELAKSKGLGHAITALPIFGLAVVLLFT